MGNSSLTNKDLFIYAIVFFIVISIAFFGHNRNVLESLERIKYESTISSAKVIFRPNKFCIITIDENTTEEEIRNLAGTCIFSHIKELESGAEIPEE